MRIAAVHSFMSITAQPRLIHFSIIDSGDVSSQDGLWQSKLQPRRENQISIPTPFFLRLGEAGRWCLFKRNRRSSLRVTPGTAYSSSKAGRCSSAWYRKTEKKQHLAF